MPSRAEIVSFDDSPPPPGANPWVVPGDGPGVGIEVTDPDLAWPRQYDGLAGWIRQRWAGGCCSWSTWVPLRSRDWRPSPSSTST
jgi:hypothetical protein